jgi:diguanylate cyclase (GGDEF)-like protein
MSELNYLKEKKITELLFIIKFSSLLFAIIGYFRYFVNKTPDVVELQFLHNFNAMAVILFLSLAFVLWLFFDQKSNGSQGIIFKIIQPIAFMTFYLGAIMFTGSHESRYKFLFVFIIVSYTIEWGLQSGIIIAAISSSIVASIDVFSAPGNGTNYYLEDDLSLIGLFFVVAITIGYYVKLEKNHILELNTLVNVDALTGLFNHRYFHFCLKQAIAEANKKAQPLSLLLCDLDFFKKYNDTHGHKGGDNLLKEIAQFLQSNLDPQYSSFRYGGDEFAIILPELSKSNALSVANTLRTKFNNTYFTGQEFMPNENITMSIGVSTYIPDENSHVDLLQATDEALYRAKYFNRNRVESYVSLIENLKLNETDNLHDEEFITTIRTLITSINAKDQFTYSHLQRVVSYCRAIAEDYNLSENEVRDLCYAAYIHDIGKIDIPKEVLMKKESLTQEETEKLHQHPIIGAKMVGKKEVLNRVSLIVLQHHEWYDGTGYPNNLKGEDIHYLSRILSVVDSFDTMASDRPYKARKTYRESVRELRRCSGTQFDPQIVEIFITAISKKCFPEYELLT